MSFENPLFGMLVALYVTKFAALSQYHSSQGNFCISCLLESAEIIWGRLNIALYCKSGTEERNIWPHYLDLSFWHWRGKYSEDQRYPWSQMFENKSKALRVDQLPPPCPAKQKQNHFLSPLGPKKWGIYLGCCRKYSRFSPFLGPHSYLIIW